METIKQEDITILHRQIRALYAELDRHTGLHGAHVPIEFGYDEDVLGSYTPASEHTKEHFYFSLAFVSYSMEHQLPKEDREDLYRHEYAHYMQYNMTIPKEYQWQSGKHGSAWKYCCSLVGAAPTEYYKFGEKILNHEKVYEKVLRNPIHDKSVPIRDNYHREMDYRKKRDSRVQSQVGQEVDHPKFGKGVIEEVLPQEGSVRLKIRFGEEVKTIDQKWLLRSAKK